MYNTLSTKFATFPSRPARYLKRSHIVLRLFSGDSSGLIRIRDLDNPERGYQTTGSFWNVAVKRNNERKMDGAQNEWRSAGNGEGREDVNTNNKRKTDELGRARTEEWLTSANGLRGKNGKEEDNRKTTNEVTRLYDMWDRQQNIRRSNEISAGQKKMENVLLYKCVKRYIILYTLQL
jgi:hypothetical protein